MRLAAFRLDARRRRYRLARAVAIALGWAAMTSMLGGQIHTLAVTHVMCAAHGELEHAEARVPATAEADQRDTSLSAGVPAAACAHEHCAIASALGRSVSPRRVATVIAQVAAPEVKRSAPVVAPPRLARVTIRLAPKTSPPRA